MKREKIKKRLWVRKIYAECLQKGEFHLLVQDLRLHEQEYFFKYFRMSPTTYEELLETYENTLKSFPVAVCKC